MSKFRDSSGFTEGKIWIKNKQMPSLNSENLNNELKNYILGDLSTQMNMHCMHTHTLIFICNDTGIDHSQSGRQMSLLGGKNQRMSDK